MKHLFLFKKNLKSKFYFYHIDRDNSDFFSQIDHGQITLEDDFLYTLKEENYQAAWEIATNLANKGKKEFLMQLWYKVQTIDTDLAFQIIKQMAYLYQKENKDIKIIDENFINLCEFVGINDILIIDSTMKELNTCMRKILE